MTIRTAVYLAFSSLPLFASIFLGCASTEPTRVEYDSEENVTIFRSPKEVIGRVSMSGGLSGGQRVTMQVFGSCPGAACIPSEIDLVFLNDSDRDLNLDYRRVAFQFGGRSLDFEDPARFHEPVQYSVPRGEFLRVPISLSDFEVLVHAPEVVIVFGLTGTTRFVLSHGETASLRAFLADVQDLAPAQ